MIERNNKSMRLCTVLLVLNLCFIWGNSLMPGTVSGALSGWLKKIMDTVFHLEQNSVSNGHHILRKLAHFTEFTSLGLVLSWLFAMLKKRPWRPILCGFLAACTDELIQCFVPDRGPGIRDVMIDTSGVLLGTGAFLLGLTIYQKKKTKFMEDMKQ